MVTDETMLAALRACQWKRKTIYRDECLWFEASCALEHLAELVDGDVRKIERLREPLRCWIERNARLVREPGLRAELEGPLRNVLYIVITEAEWARLQPDEVPGAADGSGRVRKGA